MGTSRDAVRVETRHLLLDAAQAEFSQHRFADVSLDRIAHRAGFTKGAIYSNFRSKIDLLFAVVEQRMEFDEVDYETFIADGPIEDLAGSLAGAATVVAERDLGFVRLLTTLWAVAVDDPEAATRLARLERTHRKRLTSAIKARLARAGVADRVDLEALALGIIDLGLAYLHRVSTDPESTRAETHQRAIGLLVAGALRTVAPSPGTGAGPALSTVPISPGGSC
jgi:AcrR family transcriptional regulator